MASKTISVKEETYQRLDCAKTEGESFSDVIDRLLGAETDAHPLEGLIGIGDEATVDRLRGRSAAFREDVAERLEPSS